MPDHVPREPTSIRSSTAPEPGFGYFTHRTKVGQIFDRTDNPEHPDNKGGGLSRNKTAEFIARAPIPDHGDFCKENGIEVFCRCA